jgi:hypothetical protein
MTVPCDPSFLETLALPHEDPADLRRIENEWMTAYPCGSLIERGYLRQAMVADLEKRRVERARAAVRADRVRTAVRDFEHQQEDEAGRCIGYFGDHSGYALRHLLRSAAGCRWAIEKWEDLDKKLAADQTWYGGDRITAIQLQGFSACLSRLGYEEQGYQTWLDCLVAQPNPKQRDIDLILDWHHVPKSMQDRDLKLWPGDPDASKARLRAIVDRELPRLKALEKTLREQYEEPAKAAAREIALAAVTEEDRELLRAERIHEQSYAHAVNSLLKLRTEACPARVPMVEREVVETWRREDVDRGSWSVGENQETPAVGPMSSFPRLGLGVLTRDPHAPPTTIHDPQNRAF